MASTTVVSKAALGKIDSLQIDAVLTETHTITSAITDHPVEEGSNISDHSRPEPEQLQMDCLISNTPLSGTNEVVKLKPTGTSVSSVAKADDSRAKSAYEQLLALRDKGAVVTVLTSLREYTSMAIQSISIPRDVKSREALRFSVQLKKIRVVVNKQTTQRVSKTKKANTKVKGGQQTTPATAAKPLSKAKQLFNFIGGR